MKNKKRRNKKRKKIKNFEDYVFNYLDYANKDFLKSNNYDDFIKKMEKFKFINQYYKTTDSYDNADFHYRINKYLNKKIKFKFKFKDPYINYEFKEMKSLWRHQISFCYTSAMQGNGNLSMLLMSSLESIFRLVAKEKKIKVISIKNNEDYDVEKNKTVTNILNNLNDLDFIKDYKFLYYVICKLDLRNKYCHGNLEEYDEKHLSYIVLNIIYTVFLRNYNEK